MWGNGCCKMYPFSACCVSGWQCTWGGGTTSWACWVTYVTCSILKLSSMSLSAVKTNGSRPTASSFQPPVRTFRWAYTNIWLTREADSVWQVPHLFLTTNVKKERKKIPVMIFAVKNLLTNLRVIVCSFTIRRFHISTARTQPNSTRIDRLIFLSIWRLFSSIQRVWKLAWCRVPSQVHQKWYSKPQNSSKP